MLKKNSRVVKCRALHESSVITTKNLKMYERMKDVQIMFVYENYGKCMKMWMFDGCWNYTDAVYIHFHPFIPLEELYMKGKVDSQIRTINKNKWTKLYLLFTYHMQSAVCHNIIMKKWMNFLIWKSFLNDFQTNPILECIQWYNVLKSVLNNIRKLRFEKYKWLENRIAMNVQRSSNLFVIDGMYHCLYQTCIG